jgi:hypothetical protein
MPSYTYNKIVSGSGTTEFSGLNRTFTDPTAPYHIDRIVRAHCGDSHYGQLRQQLTIKKIALLVDTFWFVDPDDTTLSGDLLFALMTAATGRERPVYYVNQAESPGLFNKYYDMCRAAHDVSDETLWPQAG